MTRPLEGGTRLLVIANLVCPVDDAINHFGTFDDHHILRAKGHRFTIVELVGGDNALAALRRRSFANLCLVQRDYDHLHTPCNSRVTRMIYLPSALCSGTQVTARGVPHRFARNESFVRVFQCSDSFAASQPLFALIRCESCKRTSSLRIYSLYTGQSEIGQCCTQMLQQIMALLHIENVLLY